MFVYSNLAISLDGKIATASRVFHPIGTDYDREMMLELRRGCDAVVVGASTFRAYKKFSLARDVKRQPMNVILSSSLEGISPSWPFFKNRDHRRLLCVSSKAPAKRLKLFEKTCDIVVLKKPTRKEPTAKQVLHALSERGIRRVLVEGGGSVMWDFVEHNLIDEYHVTLTPKLIGGTEAPTLVDGPGFEPKRILSLKLVQCRTVGDELYLTYRKRSRTPL